MLIDSYNRKIDYLRISVTDRCNLRCIYCMPALGIANKPHSQILSFEQIYKIVNAAAGLGVQKIRITGGEPLVRKDLPSLINSLKRIKSLSEIALTTNGIYLSEQVSSLKEAGLDTLNISLDSLNPQKFQKITRGGDLKAVLDGIKAALSMGFAPLKINTVLIKGLNEDEVLAFAELARTSPIHVRFIEYMSTDLNYSSYDKLFFNAMSAKKLCENLGELKPLQTPGPRTAKVFGIEGFQGTIGFISPISEPFCNSCNKLRLTSVGLLRSCLHSSKTVNLKEALDRGISQEELSRLIKIAVHLKPKSHSLSLPRSVGDPGLIHTSDIIDPENFSMCQIGG